MWSILLYELEFIDETLRKILAQKDFMFGAGTITSLYRIDDKASGASGIHETLPLRAVDERCKHPKLGETIRDWVNARWIYDPSRPEMNVCVYHNTGRGWHLHYQVCWSTQKRPRQNG